MAFLNGIFNKSPATPAPAAPAPSGPVANQKAGPANPSANPATMTGAPAAAPAAGPEPVGLDRFNDMFKPKAVDPDAPKAPTLTDPFLAPLDPEAFKKQVNSANFAAAIPAEIMTKAIGGDAAAFAEAINIAAREAFSASTQLSHGLAEHASRQAAERVSGSLDGRIRQNLIRGQNTSNEVLTKPAVAPILAAVRSQIAQNNPQLSPEVVQREAEQYFMTMASELTAPQRQAEETNKKSQVQNFAYLLENN